MDPIRAVKGTYDILPDKTASWRRIESIVRNVMRRFGYREIRTPLFEETGLFTRSIGEDTDIVGKEMYTFRDLGDRSLTLRPEGTASVVRAFVEHRLDQQGLPQKLWYMGPMFRQERPQKGRQRQFHQFGVEAIGSPSPALDAEVMLLFDTIAGELGLDDRRFLINCLGGSESRTAFRAALVAYLDVVIDNLCEDCRRRKATNPLRVLDCKVPSCRTVLDNPDVPEPVHYLTDDDRSAFESLQAYLSDLGIRYAVDARLVRGLDYYTGTVFEMQYAGLGAQSAIMGGGRYDRLVGKLGGSDMPAVGFACGMERLILAMETAGTESTESGLDVFLVDAAGNPGQALKYLKALREQGVAADMDYLGRSMKANMKSAARSGTRFAVIIEPDNSMVSVKDLTTSGQRTIPFESFLAQILPMKNNE